MVSLPPDASFLRTCSNASAKQKVPDYQLADRQHLLLMLDTIDPNHKVHDWKLFRRFQELQFDKHRCGSSGVS